MWSVLSRASARGWNANPIAGGKPRSRISSKPRSLVRWRWLAVAVDFSRGNVGGDEMTQCALRRVCVLSPPAVFAIQWNISEIDVFAEWCVSVCLGRANAAYSNGNRRLTAQLEPSSHRPDFVEERSTPRIIGVFVVGAVASLAYINFLKSCHCGGSASVRSALFAKPHG